MFCCKQLLVTLSPFRYWCPENATTYSNTPCPTGHYCPTGTAYATQYPCPKGYYNEYEGKHALVDCKPCMPGKGYSTITLILIKFSWYTIFNSTGLFPHSEGT